MNRPAAAASTATAQATAAPLLRRKCACGTPASTGQRCSRCAAEDQLRRRASHADKRADHLESAAPASVRQVLRGSGMPLDPGTRRFMENRFSRDFSKIRVHLDAAAARSADAVDAEAYTVGPHIAFAAGRYAPASPAGRRLLAHELAHTLQQPGMPDVDRLRIGASDAGEEHAADHLAERALSGASSWALSGAVPIRPAATSASRLRRQPKDDTPLLTAKPCELHFHQGTTEFTDAKEFAACLKQAKAFLSADPSQSLELHGYASEEGDVAFNQHLSQQRADIVARLMHSGGIATAKMTAVGHGEDKTYPTLPENRRVEVRMPTRVTLPGMTIEGLPCPPTSKTKVTTLEDYTTLLSCAEHKMGLGASDMLAVFRQLYYGKPWSISKASQWDQVIGCSPAIGNPKTRMGATLFDSLQASQEVAGVDAGHVFAGLESMLCPTATVTPKAGGVIGGVAGFLGMTTVGTANEDFATWAGDLGAAVASTTACAALGSAATSHSDCGGRPGPQTLGFYLRNQAPDQDLEGDIDPFVQRAKLMGISCSGSRQTTLKLGGKKPSDLFNDYYLDPSTALGGAHTHRAGCMLDALGATVASKHITNRTAIIGPLSVPVANFAEAFYVKIRGVPHTPNTSESLLMRHSLSPNAVKWFLDWLEKRL